MAILTIALALVLVGGTSLAVVLPRWKASRVAAVPAPKPASPAPKVTVTLRAESSVTLPVEQVSPDATPQVARGTIAPPVRRRLPGLMPTEGLPVVAPPPHRPTPRPYLAPKGMEAMDFSDEN